MRRKEIHIYLYVLYIYSVIIITSCVAATVAAAAAAASLHDTMAADTMPRSIAKARYKTMYACEDRQLVMDCDFGSKINLIRANYGRFSITQCNEQGQLDLSTDCMSPITFRIMRERCQDKQKCSVNATSSIFGDKCPKTRKYLEVHFQCQPDPQQQQQQAPNASSNINLFEIERVDLRSSTAAPSPSSPAIIHTHSNGRIHNPNNPISNAPLPNIQPKQETVPQNSGPSWQPSNPQLAQQPTLTPVMNSEIITYKADGYPSLSEPITATLRHINVENMSNPRCVLWDPKLNQWVPRGTVTHTNATHTTCAFDQAGSYLLVMDYLSPTLPQPGQSNQPGPIIIEQDHSGPRFEHNHLGPLFDNAYSGISSSIVTKPTVPPFGSPPIPDLFDNQPTKLISTQESILANGASSNNNANKSPTSATSSAESAVVRFFSLFGYLFAFVFIAVALGTIAFIASTMRSSAGAALKSLGNFAAFSSTKYKNGRRSDHAASGASLHNKDLLVINNQNGHQFLYAPANTTKISSSASTHILSSAGVQAGTLHQFNQQQALNAHQQQMYSANGTLSNLSGTGGQSNNYYYGLMGLTPLFQQQHSQMQHHLSQHQLHQSNQQQQQASYHHQANKSTVSNESSNSTPSSSGVESGSTSMHHQQQQQQQACLMMNTDYNLMSHQLTNYGHLPFQQPTLTTNAHYGMATSDNGNQRQLGSLAAGNPMREHIYECVDDDKTYTARLLLPTSLNTSDPFNASTLSHQHHQQQLQNQSRALTLSSRLVANQANLQPQQQNSASNNKRLLSHPAIVRDNQAKTNIICSKLVQVTPQRATEISNKFQHDVMAIYNPTDTTTTTANSSSSGNSSSCYSRAESGLNGKLSTDC